MRANGFNERSFDGPAGLSSGDPILDRVQMNLADHGGDLLQFITAAAETAQAGANLMGQIIGLMAEGQSHEAPAVTVSAQSSSAGPAIAAGLAGLAVGAGVTAAALKGKMPGLSSAASSFAPGMRGSQMPESKFYPGPEKPKEPVQMQIVNNAEISPEAYKSQTEVPPVVAQGMAPPQKTTPKKSPKPKTAQNPAPTLSTPLPQKPIVSVPGKLDCDPNYQDCTGDDRPAEPPANFVLPD